MKPLAIFTLGVVLALRTGAGEVVRTLAGTAGAVGHADGRGAQARFADPAGIAVDGRGSLFIADSANHCVRRLDQDGLVVTVVGQPGVAGAIDGPVGRARFNAPAALAFGTDGTLWIADTGNQVIRALSPAGLVRTVAGLAGEPGATNGTGTSARFFNPLGLVVSPQGWLAVADCGNHTIRRVTPGGEVTTLAGLLEDWGTAEGPSENARFNSPVGITLDSAGRLFVTDSGNHTLRRILPDGTVSTLAGRAGEDGALDGLGERARFSSPAGLVLDERGRLYVADSFNQTLRRVELDGLVSTVAGTAGSGGSADGENGAGRFFNPYGLAVKPGGSLWVSDTYNQLLREVLTPFVLRVEQATGGALIRWESVAGRRYRVLGRERLEVSWTVLTTVAAFAGPETEWKDQSVPTHRYYQVEQVDP